MIVRTLYQISYQNTWTYSYKRTRPVHNKNVITEDSLTDKLIKRQLNNFFLNSQQSKWSGVGHLRDRRKENKTQSRVQPHEEHYNPRTHFDHSLLKY